MRKLFLTVLLLGGCSEPAQPPNVLLITLDTTRADRLGCYGYPGAATPNLDRLAAGGVRFDRAVAVAPLTLPSHASILTGLYPPQHGVRTNTDFRLPPGATTLAEHLRAQGYRTAAAVGAYVLSADFGLDQGFESYDEPGGKSALERSGAEMGFVPMLERSAAEVTDAALQLLMQELPEPFFLWVHYFDPHAEYDPPPPFAERFADLPYDGEIAYVDEQIGRLLEALDGRGLAERTLVAATADHGESLGDHGEETHGLFVYESVLRVPLLLRYPAELPEGRVTDHLVSGVDLVPTLLELARLEPVPGVVGVSFADVARGGGGRPRQAVYAEAQLPSHAYGWAPLHTLHDGTSKYIDAPQPELYDLVEDPGELRNRSPADAEGTRSWAERLAALQSSWPIADPDAEHDLDPDQRARLASLGYLSSGGTVPERADPPDPKRGYALHNALLRAQALIARGELRAARTLTERVVEQDPDNPSGLGMLGALLSSTEDPSSGIELLERAAARNPGIFEIQLNLASACHLAGRTDDSAAAYRRAIDLQPRSALARFGLGNLLHATGDLEAAGQQYRAAIEAGSDAPALRIALGILAEKGGELDRARAHYAEALASAPDDADALFNFAKVSLSLEDLGAAADGARDLLASHPDHPVGRYLEAQVRLALRDAPGARAALEAFLAQDNADPRLVPEARKQLEALGD